MYINTRTASEILGCSISNVRNLIRDGRLASAQDNGPRKHMYVEMAEVEALAAEAPVPLGVRDAGARDQVQYQAGQLDLPLLRAGAGLRAGGRGRGIRVRIGGVGADACRIAHERELEGEACRGEGPGHLRVADPAERCDADRSLLARGDGHEPLDVD